MIRELLKPDDPILRKKAAKVTKFDGELKTIVKDLSETLEYTGGLGIAAPQVGIPFQIFVSALTGYPRVFINPQVVAYSKETSMMEEGCLSIPGYRGEVYRPNDVSISYLDQHGKKKIYAATKLLSKVLQHETDHLNGILYIDRMTKKDKFYQIIAYRIVFFGTPEFGLPILSTLVSLKYSFEYEVVGVVSSTDSTPIALAAKAQQIPIVTPISGSLKNPGFREALSALKPDIFVVASFGHIIPKEVLALPKYGAINVHGSLLPHYRGASPIQASLLNGDTQTGVTFFIMDEKMDEGAILGQKEIAIDPSDTYLTLSQKMAQESSATIPSILHRYLNGRIKPQPQDHTQATYTTIGGSSSTLITKESGYIDLKNPPEPKKITNMIRALTPWPGVWTKLETNGKTKLVKLLPNHKVQIEGKTPIPLEDFKRGYPDFKLDW